MTAGTEVVDSIRGKLRRHHRTLEPAVEQVSDGEKPWRERGPDGEDRAGPNPPTRVTQPSPTAPSSP